MTLALNSHGAILKVTISSTPTAIGGITNIDGPAFIHEAVEATAHDDTWAQRVSSGVADAGEVTFTVNLTPSNATQKYLWTSLTTGALEVFELSYSDLITGTTTPTNYDFSGYVTAFSPSNPIRGVITASITIAITGAVTQTDRA